MTLLSAVITLPRFSLQANLSNSPERPAYDLFVNLLKGTQTTQMDSENGEGFDLL